MRGGGVRRGVSFEEEGMLLEPRIFFLFLLSSLVFSSLAACRLLRLISFSTVRDCFRGLVLRVVAASASSCRLYEERVRGIEGTSRVSGVAGNTGATRTGVEAIVLAVEASLLVKVEEEVIVAVVVVVLF